MADVQRTTIREEWRHLTPALIGRPIRPGYQISTFGRARTIWKAGGRRCGRWRVLKGTVVTDGYTKYLFQSTSGPAIQMLAHRLVLLAFAGPCPEGMEACHDPDRDPSNNRLDNLRWDTRGGNAQDRMRHGTQVAGERVASSVLTTETAMEIVRMKRAGLSRSEIAEEAGVSEENVSHVLLGRTWSAVTGITPAPLRPRVKITADTAREVVALRRAGVQRREIVARLGVSVQMVKQILSGRSWSEATGLPKKPRQG